MSWWWLTIAVAPPLPTRPPPVEAECATAVALTVGEPPPVDLVEPSEFTVSCGAVALPTSLAGYALEMVAYGQAMDTIYKSEIEATPEPVTWWQGAAIAAGLGVLVGVYIGKD